MSLYASLNHLKIDPHWTDGICRKKRDTEDKVQYRLIQKFKLHSLFLRNFYEVSLDFTALNVYKTKKPRKNMFESIGFYFKLCIVCHITFWTIPDGNTGQ